MTLSALIRKGGAKGLANANPANSANDGRTGSAPLARLATLALANSPACNPGQAESTAKGFEFSAPPDTANDAEALAERVAIMMEGNCWSEAKAQQEARWQAHREQCWRVFLRNAARILEVPAQERSGLLFQYQAEAASRYGQDTGADMGRSLRAWITARGVH